MIDFGRVYNMPLGAIGRAKASIEYRRNFQFFS